MAGWGGGGWEAQADAGGWEAKDPNAGGWGKKKAGGGSGGSWGDEDLLWTAVTEALQPVMHHEWNTDQPKLEKKVRDYFRKGAKGLAFGAAPYYVLINEYADTVFGALFSGLGDKEWLTTCDFLLCLDAGIKDTFPQNVLQRVPQTEFEKTVLAAHDRAFEEQRVLPLMWEAVQAHVEGPKSRKKVYNALEAAWKEVKPNGGHNEAQDFVWQWIERSVAHLSEVCQGEPHWTLEPPVAEQMFHAIIGQGGLPMALITAYGQPPMGWPVVGQCVYPAYAQHTVVYDTKGGGKGGKAFSAFGGKGKGKGGKQKRKPNPLLQDLPENTCLDFVLGKCTRETCKFDHDENTKAEVELKRDLQEAEKEAEREAEGLGAEEEAAEGEEEPAAKKGRF